MIAMLGEPFIEDNVDPGEPNPGGPGYVYLEVKPYGERHEKPLPDRRQCMQWNCGNVRDCCHAIGNAFTDEWYMLWCRRHADLYNDGCRFLPKDLRMRSK